MDFITREYIEMDFQKSTFEFYGEIAENGAKTFDDKDSSKQYQVPNDQCMISNQMKVLIASFELLAIYNLYSSLILSDYLITGLLCRKFKTL